MRFLASGIAVLCCTAFMSVETRADSLMDTARMLSDGSAVVARSLQACAAEMEGGGLFGTRTGSCIATQRRAAPVTYASNQSDAVTSNPWGTTTFGTTTFGTTTFGTTTFGTTTFGTTTFGTTTFGTTAAGTRW